MGKNKIMLILGICAGAAALALAILAFRFAKHEEEYRSAESRKVLLSECRILAERCLDVLKNEERKLCEVLRASDGSVKALGELQSRNPFIRQAFTTDAVGNPVFPKKDDAFYKPFNSLFFEHVSSAVEKDETGKPLNGNRGKEDSYAKLSSRFGMAVKDNSAGWLPWITENRLRPVVWAKSQKNTSRIIGAEIELMTILSRMIPVFPQGLPEYFSIELTDTQEKTVYGVNFRNQENAKVKKSTPDVIVPVSLEMVPGWQIRGYLDASMLGGSQGFVLFNFLQIVSLILILLGCGALIFWFVRREIELAGQKTSFVANVSHELKTPLTSIRMYTEMLLMSKDKISQEKQSHYLSVILSESERLSRLISNVLSFSRMEAGQKKYNQVTFSLKDFLEEICALHRQPLNEKGIAMHMEMQDETLAVFIDRDSLVQIMENLISNASKYALEGKEVTIAIEKNGSETIIKVMDRGAGIPAGSANKIFNKFYRCDNSLISETRGNGLGLTIARGMARDQGGDLIYSPREGGGSVFSVIIRETRS